MSTRLAWAIQQDPAHPTKNKVRKRGWRKGGVDEGEKETRGIGRRVEKADMNWRGMWR